MSPPTGTAMAIGYSAAGGIVGMFISLSKWLVLEYVVQILTLGGYLPGETRAIRASYLTPLILMKVLFYRRYSN